VPAPQVTVIGLDAATFTIIDPMIEAGELPHLARLFQRGSRGILRSTTHPLTPQAWTTLATGVNAGRHGIWDFSERTGGGYHLRVVNGSFRRAPALWDRLSATGHRVGLINVPFTWPAPEVNGFAVAGMDAASREEGFTHPSSLLAEIMARFGTLEVDHGYPLDSSGRIDLDLVRTVAAQRVELASWLCERFAPEFLFVVFMSADHIHHLCWDEWEREGLESRVAHVYRILDDVVGGLVELSGLTSDVLIVSDHGGGSLNGVVNLNAWLAAQGYLAYAGARKELARRIFNGVFSLRQKVPAGLRYAVKQQVPLLRERAYELREFSVIDPSRTRAFAYGIFGNIVLNVRGREAEGIVEPGEEYEGVRDEIARGLRELRAPSGERIVAAVHRREDLFEGDELEKIPDLVVEFRDYAWLGKGSLKQKARSLWDQIAVEAHSEHKYAGSHRHEGIFALAGPSAAQGANVTASIEDVMPTILYLLDEAIPSGLDGRIVTEALSDRMLDSRPPVFDERSRVEFKGVDSYAPDNSSAVERRLRELGYIE
jgi:predicted AlkP superfamily phosphohydrolase/phosphomutase